MSMRALARGVAKRNHERMGYRRINKAISHIEWRKAVSYSKPKLVKKGEIVPKETPKKSLISRMLKKRGIA